MWTTYIIGLFSMEKFYLIKTIGSENKITLPWIKQFGKQVKHSEFKHFKTISKQYWLFLKKKYKQ